MTEADEVALAIANALARKGEPYPLDFAAACEVVRRQMSDETVEVRDAVAWALVYEVAKRI